MFEQRREVLSNLAVSRSWECKRKREPCWVWLVGSWLMAEGSRLTPPVSEEEKKNMGFSSWPTHF